MQTLSKGQLLLDRLREASSHADINNRHATKAACFSIERTLETLSHRRRKLDELWKSRRKTLEQCVRRCLVQDETEKVQEFRYDKVRRLGHKMGFPGYLPGTPSVPSPP